MNVSIILPTYNRTELLDRAIKSVLAQTWQQFELLVIDDGSTEDISVVVNRQQDARIRCIHHEQNRGLAAAWNTGIRAASADWIAFLDSDDVWPPEKLAKQIQFQQSHPESMAIGTGYYQIGVWSNSCVIPSPKQAQYRSILFENILHLGTTFLVRKAAFDELGYFNEGLLRGQDTDWLLRFCQQYPIQILPEPLVTVYQHTNRSAEKLERSRLQMIALHEAEYAKFGSIFQRRKLANMYADIAYQYEREQNRPKMREYARKVLQHNPFQSIGIYLILLDALTGWHTKRRSMAVKRFLSQRRKK